MILATLWESFLHLNWAWWLDNLTDWLPMSPIEIVAVVFGIWSVWCDVKEHIWTWPTGLINVLLYIVLFWNCRLYCETALQVVFVVLQLYGWWEWQYGGEKRTGVVIRRTTADEWLTLSLMTVAATLPVGYAIKTWTNSTTPWWDTIPTVLSLVAQYMMTKKWLENWWVWIAVDVISIPLFAYKELYLTAGLYLLFLALCIKGYAAWKKSLSPVTAVA